ncbi:MAG: ABC transporter permease [Anaerolineae bacterium]|nr:MAG: ABC transporter permease [Anaerolineae bacterium]
MIGDLITASVLASGIRLATPYLYAALGETFGQRSGVLNLGVEGVMLMGAFTSLWAVHEFTPAGAASYDAGALAMGVLVAILVGLIMGLATAVINVTLQAEQGISGIGIYLFGLGMSDLLFQKVFGGNVVTVNGFPKVHIPLLSDLPVLGEIFFRQNLLVYFAFALVPVTWFVLNKTTLGLKIRAVGQNPEAADAMGISVARVRYFTVTLGGVLASLAGASLSISLVNVFQQNMTAGQGFIAVALVYFGSWRARGVMFGALLFSLVNALQLQVRTKGIDVPDEYAAMAPYLLTIIALIFASQRIDQPAALTKPFERGE